VEILWEGYRWEIPYDAIACTFSYIEFDLAHRIT